MRRAPIVLTATILGTAGVLLFKPIGTGTPADARTSGTTTSSDTTDSSSTDSSPSDSSSSGSSSDSPGSSSASSTVKDGTYTGAAETVRFGTTQVEVTIAEGKITDVAVVQLNQDDPRSNQISQAAVPVLREEVLAKQTAAVDTVSGATYTSGQYGASLQSALDQAGYTAPDGTKASTDVSDLQESRGGFGPGH